MRYTRPGGVCLDELIQWLEGYAGTIPVGWRAALIIVALMVVLLLTAPIARGLDHLVRRVFTRFGERGKMGIDVKRAVTLGTLIGSIVRMLTWMLGAAVCLDLLGLERMASTLIGTAGIGGLVVGFGAQKLIQDFFSGLALITTKPFVVGDFVTIDGVSGFVESLKMRTCTVRAFTGEIHTIPNGTIGTVTNLSKNHTMALVDIYVSTSHPYEWAQPLLLRAAQEAAQGEEAVLEPPMVLGIISFSDRGKMLIRTICKTKPLGHWALERKIRAAQLAAILAAESQLQEVQGR